MKYTALLIILFTGFQLSAQKTVNGRITKAGGGILAGVKVSAKDAPMIFTLSDEHGNYIIEIPEEVTSLVFSYSGMATKTVKIKDFIAINVKLVPANYRKFRYGTGLSTGSSSFSIYTVNTVNKNDTTVVKLIPFSLHADFFYRFHKNFGLQAVVEDGINVLKGDAVSDTTSSKPILNRFTVSVLLNYNFKLSKNGNHSAFTGFGPQYQHLTGLNTNTMGIRFQGGVNINNYGFTSRIYIAVDVINGKFSENNIYVAGLPYKYISSRLGVTFIF